MPRRADQGQFRERVGARASFDAHACSSGGDAGSRVPGRSAVGGGSQHPLMVEEAVCSAASAPPSSAF